ncbi:MAG: class I SAM-dependent methyltransferase [Stackebrandtia sp.]
MTEQHRDVTTDATVLATSAYDGDRHLAARQHLYDYQQPTYDLPGIVSELLRNHQFNTIVDVGCGNGRYVTRLRHDYLNATIIGIDIAPGMLTPIDPPVAQANAMNLPFPDRSVDVVLAMHMIYHLPNIPSGIGELARVLKPGGLLVASTNARDDKTELDDLWTAAAGEVLGTQKGPRRVALSERFPLDDAGDYLANHFTDITIHPLPGTITVTTPEPIIAHLASYESFADHTGVPFPATINAARRHLARHIAQHGTFTTTCHGGIITTQPKEPA